MSVTSQSPTKATAIVEIKDICVGDEMGYLVLLKVGNQQFSVGDAYEKGDKDEAEWYAEMLRKALAIAGARSNVGDL